MIRGGPYLNQYLSMVIIEYKECGWIQIRWTAKRDIEKDKHPKDKDFKPLNRIRERQATGDIQEHKDLSTFPPFNPVMKRQDTESHEQELHGGKIEWRIIIDK